MNELIFVVIMLEIVWHEICINEFCARMVKDDCHRCFKIEPE